MVVERGKGQEYGEEEGGAGSRRRVFLTAEPFSVSATFSQVFKMHLCCSQGM